MERFTASVQYNDIVGSSAADKADNNHATQWLKDNGHISDDEYILGIKLWAGENHGTHRDPVSVRFVVSDLKGFSNIPELIASYGDNITAKVIDLDMPIAEFLGLFKRFEVSLSNGGILEGKSF
ncbi:MAG: hypothetical protein ACTIJ4_01645 [Halomonas sp.]|uniref:hypothetical protein n=1 Tax=Halomonas sp. TaxID=1486246 RepID=UPI003F9A19AC